MNQILELLRELRPDVDFTESTDFIEDYLLDSLDIMALTAELEGRYGIRIRTDHIVPESFKDVDAIANLVRISGGTLP